MTHGEKRELFTSLLALLIQEANRRGYSVRLGNVEAERENRSCHPWGLAADLNLFKDGIYLEKTEDHFDLGVWWEGLHSLCRWGGRFSDGNHYSLEHLGVR